MVKRVDRTPSLRVPLLCVASGLALTACSPQGANFLPGVTQAPNHGAAPGHPAHPAPAAASTAPAPTGPFVARRASTLISMPVQSQSGQPLGTIQDFVLNDQGRATHVVLNSVGKLVAIPWRVAVTHIHDGILVLDPTRLAGAPSFSPGAWPDFSSASWSATADSYWTTPVDSPSRSRNRPDR